MFHFVASYRCKQKRIQVISNGYHLDSSGTEWYAPHGGTPRWLETRYSLTFLYLKQPHRLPRNYRDIHVSGTTSLFHRAL